MPDSKSAPPQDVEVETESAHYISYLEKELSQARKFEEIGMLAAVVAHDLNNILTPIFGYSTILKRDIGQDHPLAKAVGVIEKSAERASILVGKLLGCARQKEAVSVPFDLGAMLDEFFESLNGEAISIEKSYCGLPPLLGDPHQIAVVIRVVCDNAIEAMAENGTLSISASPVDIDADFCRRHPPLKPGPHVCLKFADTGHGIPAELLTKVFEPFFSTKPLDACPGVGLTIAQNLIRRNAGCLELESQVGKGTIVGIYIPVAPPQV